MKHRIAVLAVVLAGITLVTTASAPCWGARVSGPAAAASSQPAVAAPTFLPPGPLPAAVLGTTPEQKQVAAIQAMLTTGDYDKAIDAAKAYIISSMEDSTKTEALRLIAEACRKKGDWKQSVTAHMTLRGRYDKTKDEFTRCEAIAEVLRNSPNGVYVLSGPGGVSAPPVAKPASTAPTGTDPAATGPGTETVANDSVLSEALTRVAVSRIKNLKPCLAAIKTARTQDATVTAFSRSAELARQIYAISPDAPPDSMRELATAAGAKLQDLATPIVNAVQAKITQYQPKRASGYYFWDSMTNQDKADISNCITSCKKASDAEKAFQDLLPKVIGKGAWPDGEHLKKDSAGRASNYDNLAKKMHDEFLM